MVSHPRWNGGNGIQTTAPYAYPEEYIKTKEEASARSIGSGVGSDGSGSVPSVITDT